MKNDLSRRGFIKTTAMASLGIGLLGPQGKFSESLVSTQQRKRVGIIGLDTSHSVAFTKALNAVDADPRFRNYKVVAAVAQGSKDIPSAISRVPKYVEEVSAAGVEIVGTIAELLKKVDVVLLESNDGRVHLEQATPVIKAGKTLFIDKPIAASYQDAQQIFQLARQYKVPVFSSSSLRFMEKVKEVKAGSIGAVYGAETFSPATLEPTHPDFYWYGIHGIETLFALMGTGCENVTRFHTPDVDLVVGKWKDGRVGTFRGIRKGKHDFGGMVFGEKGNITLGQFKGYDALLEEIVAFFDTGISPVSAAETLEICAFIEAADESKRQHGKTITLINA